MKIKLKSSYPCLVKNDNFSFDINENDLLEIEEEENLFVYPISYSRRNIPFYINLNDLKDCTRYSVFELGGEKLIFLNKGDKVDTLMKESLLFGDDKCEIKISFSNLIFENSRCIVKCELESPFENYQVFKVENFACVEFDEKSVFAFNMKKNRLYRFKGDKIEFEKDLIKIYDNLNDVENRKKSCIYKLSTDTVKIEKCEFECEQNGLEDDMTAYRFLEALKVKDVSFAKNFLGDNLRKIEETDLANFFGNVSNFYPLSLEEFIVENLEKKTIVRFEMKKGKIEDISVNELSKY